MRTHLDRDQNAMRKRAVKAMLLALVIFGGGYAWHNASSGRTAVRAEQARLESLRMTPKKSAALAREAARDAAAKAFAEKQAAEQQVRTVADEQQDMKLQPAAAPGEG